MMRRVSTRKATALDLTGLRWIRVVYRSDVSFLTGDVELRFYRFYFLGRGWINFKRLGFRETIRHTWMSEWRLNYCKGKVRALSVFSKLTNGVIDIDSIEGFDSPEAAPSFAPRA